MQTGSLIPISKSAAYADLIAHDGLMDILENKLQFTDVKWMR